MSKLKNFGIAITFTLILFIITAVIFPWQLYPLDARKFEPIPIKPGLLDSISTTQIYLRGVLALFPWLILSPWTLISQMRCSEEACLIIIPITMLVSIGLFFLYSLFVYFLVSFIKSKNTTSLHKWFKIIFFVWILSLIIGIIVVYKDYLYPPLRYNKLISTLQDISNKEPFPHGTKFTTGRCGLSCKGYIYRYTWDELELLLRYENPDNSNEAYDAYLSFFSSPKSELITKFGCKQSKKIIVDLSRCDNLPYTAEVRYFGFIDRQHKIHAETSWWYLDIVRNPNLVPTFFSYYDKT